MADRGFSSYGDPMDVRSMGHSAFGPSEGESEADFLRRRVSMAGVVCGDAFLVFLVFRSVEILIGGQYEMFVHASYVLHALTALVFFSMWLILRLPGLSVSAVRTVEAVGLLGGTLTTILMGLHIPRAARPDFIILTGIVLFFFARSIWVPSTARRTAILGTAIGLPMVIATYYLFIDIDAALYQEVLSRDIDVEFTAQSMASGAAAAIAVYWVLAVATAASASKVFYGLRKQVEDAKQLGQYKLERKLGEGGMGMVFRATHGMLRRPTAVKLLLPEKAGEHNLLRFEREVQLTATLTHPNTVTIFDYGRTPDGVFYYAMELLDGATLEDIVELRVPVAQSRVLKILQQTAGALSEAHGLGLVHRDIKPSNIMLCRYGGQHDMVKVLDFGLVKQLQGASNALLTQTESLTGTPQYMSPEAITDAESVDARGDIYSLGCVAYYLLTGEHVFTGKTVVEVCSHHLHTPPTPPSEVTERPIDAHLEALILRCLAKSPQDRPADGAELINLLEQIDLGEVWRERDAVEWWDEYRIVLHEDRDPSSVDTALRTIDIDMERRRAATHRSLPAERVQA
ncbi:MAG: serine/threonine-protein kinase [Myxococcota bacterium]